MLWCVHAKETDVETPSTVWSKEAIEAMLARGLSPITDNIDALIELGFERSYPTARSGYDQTLWERSIDLGLRSTYAGLRRVMVCQRAFLRPSRGNADTRAESRDVPRNGRQGTERRRTTAP
jgi:hypothetical protein